MSFIFSNEAKAVLTSAADSTDVVLEITPAKADRFAEPTGADVQRCIIRDDTEAFEIIDITTNNGDGTVDVDRGVEGTVAQDWPAGAIIEQYFSAAVIASVALTAGLAAISALTPAANKIIRYTSSSAAELLTLTDFGASLLDDADEATFKATVNLEIGVDVQAFNALLSTYVSAGGLTTAEVQQLQNIGATTINATRWGYLGAATALGGSLMAVANAAALADLADLGAGDSVTFADVSITDDLTVGDDASIGGDLAVAGTATMSGVIVCERGAAEGPTTTGIKFNTDAVTYAQLYQNNAGEIIFDTTSGFVAKPAWVDSVNGTLTAVHANRVLYVNGNVTIPASVFNKNEFLILVGDGTVRTVTQGGGGTQTLAGSTSTGNFSLAVNGVAVVMFGSATSWKIGGNVS